MRSYMYKLHQKNILTSNKKEIKAWIFIQILPEFAWVLPEYRQNIAQIWYISNFFFFFFFFWGGGGTVPALTLSQTPMVMMEDKQW